MSTRQVRRLVASGQLDRLHLGVYRVSGTPPTWEQRMLAACFATGGIASHRSALRLWGIEGWARDPDCPVEVTVTPDRCPRPQGVTVRRSVDMDRESVPRRQRIPTSRPLRMLVDVGAVLHEDEVARVLEHCVVSRLVTVAAVRNELERTARQGRRGVRALRSVLADWPVGDVPPDSILEVAFARLCRRAGLPRPVVQHELVLGGRRRRLDFAYPTDRIAIEVDGFGTRTDRRVFQDERWRQNDLLRAGWRVARFTWHDITHRPEYVVSTVRSFLRAAG